MISRWLFVLTSLLLIVTSGQNMVLVMSRSIAQGATAGVVTAAGVSFGLVGHTVLATLGLGAILRTWEWLFVALKLVQPCDALHIRARPGVRVADVPGEGTGGPRRWHALELAARAAMRADVDLPVERRDPRPARRPSVLRAARLNRTRKDCRWTSTHCRSCSTRSFPA